MAYYRDIREHIAVLEREGKLVRVSQEMNKDTEIHPLVRLQFRGGLSPRDRKGWFFERVTDVKGRKYDMPYVVGVYAASREIYALGMQCKPEEIFQKWLDAQNSPIDPVIVDSAVCQEIVLTGDEIKNVGVDRFPVPISTPGFDTAPFMTAANWISVDPETGIPNVGNYRAQLKAPDRLGLMCGGPYQGLAKHWELYRKLGKRMPVAAIIGPPPNIGYVATARIQHGLNEYGVAGAIAGEPVQLVKCKTNDLLVPAWSEVIIEGTVSIDELEREGPFGEFPGCMAAEDVTRFMTIDCITTRRDPIWVGFISQFPPSESSLLRGTGIEGAIRKKLQDAGIGDVLDVRMHESTGSWGLCVIKIRKQSQEHVDRILDEMSQGILMGKMLVVVDEDIDALDADSVNWAIAYRMQPHRDVRIVEAIRMGLDPSISPPGDPNAVRNVVTEGDRATALFIDATRPWAYASTSLPRREFMDHAREVWNELGLPPIQQLKEPWFGYDLGYVNPRAQEEAILALQGEHFEVGRRAAAERSKL